MLPSTLAAGAFLTAHAKKELDWTLPIAKGAKQMSARRVQEYLSLHGFAVAIDGDFGPATEHALMSFQTKRGLTASGVVDAPTFDALAEPLVQALQPISGAGKKLSDLTLDYALQHVAQHPVEVGGPNSGPWVRLYLGFEGPGALWCAGFACYPLRQAADTLGVSMPIAPSASCDVLAQGAKAAGSFLAEAKVKTAADRAKIKPGSFFLVRATDQDWTHVGIVSKADADAFGTVEGNSNSNGSSNGFEALQSTRGYAKKDFIVW